MFHILAEIPPNIDSRELYESLKPYKLNVVDMISHSIAFGRVSHAVIYDVLTILFIHNAMAIHITKKTR